MLRSLRTIRNFPRLKTIAVVLVKYGLYHAAALLGAPAGARLRRWMPRPFSTPMRQAERLRLAFQELGPTFIKLGQLIANRPDLFSEELVLEFAKLEDRVAPVPFERIRAVLREELGAEPERHFTRIDEQPLAVASIAQIHRARTSDGEEVVLKVQKPGIEAIVRSDLEILSIVAEALSHGEQMKTLDLEGMINEGRRALLRELNFNFERNALERVRRNFAGDPTFVVPRTRAELSSRRLLVMEFIDGVSLRRQPALDPERARRVARECARVVFEMVFRDGYFHADPHASNILLLADGRIAWVDFGSMGILTEEMRAQLFRMLAALMKRDYQLVARIVMKLGRRRGDHTLFEFTQDMASRLDPYFGLTVEELEVASLFQAILELARDYEIAVAPGFTIMTRCLLLIEGVTQHLDPGFNAMSEMEPILRRAGYERLRPDRVLHKLAQSVLESAETIAEYPAQVGEILRRAAQGRFRVETELKDLEQFARRVEASNTRVVQAIIVSALLVSSSLVVQRADIGPQIGGLPILGLIGYVAAGFLGFWIVLSILRR